MSNEALMPEISSDDGYDEEWKVVMSTKGDYTLNKMQARILQQEMAGGSRGIVMFQTFAISIPYVAEFYRVRRFLKDTVKLPERATEGPYKPIPPEKWEAFKKDVYGKIGKVV